MKLISFGKTEKGEDHLENEDAILVDYNLKLYAVADGVSLPYGGKEASERAINYLKSYFKGNLKNAVDNVNKKICDEKIKNPKIGSTTLSACFIKNKSMFVAHVGDSSVFLVSKNKIKELTTPDSIGNVLLQAIGQLSINIHFYEEGLDKGNYVIICTDGITDVLNKEEILSITVKHKEPKNIVEALIKETKNRTRLYKDDLSAIVIFVQDL